MDVGLHEIGIIEAEARNRDDAGNHFFGEAVEILIMRTASQAGTRISRNHRGLPLAAGSPSSLSIVTR